MRLGTELRVVAIRPIDDTIVLVLRDVASGNEVTVRVASVRGGDVAIRVGRSVTGVAAGAQPAARGGRAVLTSGALAASEQP